MKLAHVTEHLWQLTDEEHAIVSVALRTYASDTQNPIAIRMAQSLAYDDADPLLASRPSVDPATDPRVIEAERIKKQWGDTPSAPATEEGEGE